MVPSAKSARKASAKAISLSERDAPGMNGPSIGWASGQNSAARPTLARRVKPSRPTELESTIASGRSSGHALRRSVGNRACLFSLSRTQLSGGGGACRAPSQGIPKPHGSMMLCKQIPECLIGQFLERGVSVARQEIERMPTLRIELDELAAHVRRCTLGVHRRNSILNAGGRKACPLACKHRRSQKGTGGMIHAPELKMLSSPRVRAGADLARRSHPARGRAGPKLLVLHQAGMIATIRSVRGSMITISSPTMT